MAGNKTKPTKASVARYISSRANEEQRRDCARLVAMLERITKQKPKMCDTAVLEKLIVGSVAEVERRYG